MTNALIGFVIAVAVGMTGIGSGSFTVPALLLIAGLSAGEAVGTAFVFGGVLRLIAVPFYMGGRQIHSRYLRLLLLGAVPGLIVGMYALHLLAAQGKNPLITILLGLLLAISSSVTFFPRAQRPDFVSKNSHWLPWLAFPIGVENGFSSAGAGALGTVLLLNYSDMTPTQVIGTDLSFGLILATMGSAVTWRLGLIDGNVLLQLLAGGLPGVLLGCLVSKRVPARKLKAAVAMVALCAGFLLVRTGVRNFVTNYRSRVAHTTMSMLPGPSRP